MVVLVQDIFDVHLHYPASRTAHRVVQFGVLQWAIAHQTAHMIVHFHVHRCAIAHQSAHRVV